MNRTGEVIKLHCTLMIRPREFSRIAARPPWYWVSADQAEVRLYERPCS